jgi:hypothetical protein
VQLYKKTIAILEGYGFWWWQEIAKIKAQQTEQNLLVRWVAIWN